MDMLHVVLTLGLWTSPMAAQTDVLVPSEGVAAAAAPQQGEGRGQQRAQQATRGQGQGQGQQRGQQANRGQGQGRGQQRAQQANRGQGQNQQRAQQANRGQGQGQGQQRGQQANRGQGQGQQRAQRASAARGAGVDEGRAAGAGSGAGRSAGPSNRREGVGGRSEEWGRSPGRVLTASELPSGLRRLAASDRTHERFVMAAATVGTVRGLDVRRLDVQPREDRVLLLNDRGDLLFDLDERRARELGAWEMRRLGDRRPTANAPSFCRSGAGHPVWGREWCLDKGFGLGSRAGTIWSRALVSDVVFLRPVTGERLVREALIGLVGDVVFGRLALHALTLGLVDPLSGHWIAQPAAPAVLHVYSGDVVVAELIDLNRDSRVDVLYVVQPL